MQPRAQRQIGRLPIMHVPEAPRQPLQQLHRARRVSVMRGFDHKPIELAVEPHESDIVVGLGGAVHAAGDFLKFSRCSLGRAFGAGAAQQPLELAAHFEHQKLMPRIDVRNQNALARQDDHQTLMRQPLQRFAHRRSPDPEGRRQHLLGENVAGLEPQRDDLFLDQPIGLIGQRFRAGRRAGGRRGRPSTGGRRRNAVALRSRHVKSAFVWRPWPRISRIRLR